MFTSYMSILVNGSTTKEFMVEKELCQSDPLSMFLLVLAMESLTRLMKKVVALNEFLGFRVNHEVSFDILQFAEDTIILGDYSWSNLWSIKAILRGFEPFSSLHIN